jgi:hypothetical protein
MDKGLSSLLDQHMNFEFDPSYSPSYGQEQRLEQDSFSRDEVDGLFLYRFQS